MGRGTNKRNSITDKVCLFNGHKISSYPQAIIDPASKQSFITHEIMCSVCGLSLEEIRNYGKLRKRRTKKELEVISNAIAR